MHIFADEFVFDPVRLGRVIAELRESNGLTQAELAHRAAVSQANISDAETGKIDLSLEKFVRISLVLRCQPGLLIERAILFSEAPIVAAYNEPEVRSLATVNGKLDREHLKHAADFIGGLVLALQYLVISVDPEAQAARISFPLESLRGRFAEAAKEVRMIPWERRLDLLLLSIGELSPTLREFNLYSEQDLTEYLSLALSMKPAHSLWTPCPALMEEPDDSGIQNAYAVRMRFNELLNLRPKIGQLRAQRETKRGAADEPVASKEGFLSKLKLTNLAGEETRSTVISTEKLMSIRTWKHLRAELRACTAHRGGKSQLAEDLKVSRQVVASWLRKEKAHEPSADFTLRLLAWVAARKAKQ